MRMRRKEQRFGCTGDRFGNLGFRTGFLGGCLCGAGFAAVALVPVVAIVVAAIGIGWWVCRKGWPNVPGAL